MTTYCQICNDRPASGGLLPYCEPCYRAYDADLQRAIDQVSGEWDVRNHTVAARRSITESLPAPRRSAVPVVLTVLFLAGLIGLFLLAIT